MMKKNSIILVAISLVATFLFSCNEKGDYPGFKETEDGLLYKFHTESNDTQVVRLNDILKVHLNYKKGDSSFNKSAINQPIDIKMMEQTYPGDIFDGLKMMHIGDSATFILKAKDFFEKTVGSKLPEFLDTNDVFFLDVKMDTIISSIELARKTKELNAKLKEAEPQKLQSFLEENSMDESHLVDGVYLKHINKGDGKKIENGKHAEIHFKVKVVGEEWFDNTRIKNEPYTYLVGTGRFTEGFDKAILNMKVGGKALTLIPSSLAFGEQGFEDMIPPYSPIAFEIEIVKLLTDEEYQKLLEEEEAKQMKSMEEASERERNELQAFMNSQYPNAQKHPSGIYILNLQKGEGKTAKSGNKLKIHYDGYLLNGTKFDSSKERGEPFEFELGQGQVIQGWDIALNGMKEGEKAKIF